MDSSDNDSADRDSADMDPTDEVFDSDARFAPVGRVRARRVGNELILLHLDQGNYYALNEVGAEVWESCGDGLALAQILERLLERYEVDEETLQNDLQRVIRELVERGLVEPEKAEGERAKGRRGEKA